MPEPPAAGDGAVLTSAPLHVTAAEVAKKANTASHAASFG
jgi:hypothetical protein